MTDYSLKLTNVTKHIYSSSLKLGGVNPNGDRIGFSNYYMEINGEPYFGICGEMHYSRYPQDEWENEIAKMKMSGITIMAAYIFWNHHEETEGNFRWDGDRNLRRFIELCGKHGLYIILRVGPFCHGEVRNGGLPDWIFGRAFEVRSNDEAYLAYVRKLYFEIGKQSSGLMFKDGGPVIGVQLENELMHAAAIWELTAKTGDEYLSGGSGGKEHMRMLKTIAQEAGLDAPIYTSTGWGGAPVLEDEVLALYGGYAYTPWTVNESNRWQKPTNEYVFRDFHNNATPSDQFDTPYPKENYPFACCEMGGGMQSWYLARFVVEPESVAAMTIMKVAGGCNFIGYYMYHGGTNPIGQFAYMNESTTPKFTYDFQAPLGEFGQVRRSDDLLRPLHYFFRHFGRHLAPMATVLPEGAANIRADDTESLRYAARMKDGSGFLFLNNYQDHVVMRDHEGVVFKLALDGETLELPRNGLTIERNVSAVLPFNFPLDGGILLKYATAQPVSRIDADGRTTYFFAMPRGMEAELAIENSDGGPLTVEADHGSVMTAGPRTFVNVTKDRTAFIRIKREDGTEIRICVLSTDQAEKLREADFQGSRRLFISDAPLLAGDDSIRLMLSGRQDAELRLFPPLERPLRLERAELPRMEDGIFELYRISLPTQPLELETVSIAPHKTSVRIDRNAFEQSDDIILKVEYEGNVGYAFADGIPFHDNFCNGTPWEIGLRRFRERIEGKEVILQVTPLRQEKVTIATDAAFALQRKFSGESIAVIHSVTAIPVMYIRLDNG